MLGRPIKEPVVPGRLRLAHDARGRGDHRLWLRLACRAARSHPGIAAALNRQPWKPGHNAHNQTLEEAIAAYTRDAAYAEFQEAKKGHINVGMLADMVLLSDNIFAVPSEELAGVRVTMTVVDGRVVYER